MASYLGDIERNTLPSIRRSGLLETGINRRITFDDGALHRYQSGSPTAAMFLSDSHLQPRPPSPTQRRAVTEVYILINVYIFLHLMKIILAPNHRRKLCRA